MSNVVVTFPLSGENAFTPSVTVSEAEYCHEIAVISLPDPQVGTAFVKGTPVHIMWQGSRGGKRDWYGYVDTVETGLSGPEKSNTATCVGMTYPLKEQRQDVWTNVTGDGVAESMAARWRLGIDLGYDTRVWDTIAQAGVSDWTLLSTLAHDIGFTLYARGPLLCFHERIRELLRLADYAPVFIYTAHSPSTDIMSFVPQTSATVNGNVRQQISGIDSSGQAMTLANDTGAGTLLATIDTLPSFTTVNTRTTASGYEAMRTLTSQAEDQRFSVRASATVAGDSRLRPAMPVYLGGLPAQWNGLWFVLAVTHRLTSQSDRQVSPGGYSCELSLGRDGMGISDSLPAFSDVHHTDEAVAEIGATGLWQCGPIPRQPQEDAPSSFVIERLARAKA